MSVTFTIYPADPAVPGPHFRRLEPGAPLRAGLGTAEACAYLEDLRAWNAHAKRPLTLDEIARELVEWANDAWHNDSERYALDEGRGAVRVYVDR